MIGFAIVTLIMLALVAAFMIITFTASRNDAFGETAGGSLVLIALVVFFMSFYMIIHSCGILTSYHIEPNVAPTAEAPSK